MSKNNDTYRITLYRHGCLSCRRYFYITSSQKCTCPFCLSHAEYDKEIGIYRMKDTYFFEEGETKWLTSGFNEVERFLTANGGNILLIKFIQELRSRIVD